MTVKEPTLHEHAMLVVFGADQQQHYFPLPASVDASGTVMTEWEPSAEDLATLMCGGRVRIWLLYTGVEKGRPLTPIKVETIDAS